MQPEPKRQPNNANHCHGDPLPKVATVVLNYNSESDLRGIIPQLIAQTGVCHSIIVVDNSSSSDSFGSFLEWLRTNAIGIEECLGQDGAGAPDFSLDGRKIKLVRNARNVGYSAGNNVGIRLAIKNGCDYVMIVNPDIRIADTGYLLSMVNVLRENGCAAAVGSRVIDVGGRDQNPLRELSFFEELLWPIHTIKLRLFRNAMIYDVGQTKNPIEVPKISGCCLVLRSSFLSAMNLLDENVFLYCEEPILSARVRQLGYVLLYDPSRCVVHRHVSSEKGAVSRRMAQFVKSRIYYLTTYSNYSAFQLGLLKASYSMLRSLHRAREHILGRD